MPKAAERFAFFTFFLSFLCVFFFCVCECVQPGDASARAPRQHFHRARPRALLLLLLYHRRRPPPPLRRVRLRPDLKVRPCTYCDGSQAKWSCHAKTHSRTHALARNISLYRWQALLWASRSSCGNLERGCGCARTRRCTSFSGSGHSASLAIFRVSSSVT